MAHIEKFKRGSAANMTRHVERARGKDGEFLNFSNANIDISRTHLNYNLADQPLEQMEFINKRIGGLKRTERRDAVVLASCCITKPRVYRYNPADFQHIAHLSEEEQEEHFTKLFFQVSCDFIEQRYGKKNMVSAWTHFDEQNPHIHCFFVPIAEVDGEERLSFKAAVPRKSYISLHKDLHAYLLEQTGVDFAVLNGTTAEKKRELEKLERKLELREDQIDAREDRIVELESETAEYAARRDRAKQEYTKLAADVTRLAVKAAISPELEAAKAFMDTIKFADGITALKRFEDIRAAKILQMEQKENSRQVRDNHIDLSHIPAPTDARSRQKEREFSI